MAAKIPGKFDAPGQALWKQVAALMREVESVKISIYGNSLESILARLEGIEKEIDLLLSILHESRDKKSDYGQKY